MSRIYLCDQCERTQSEMMPYRLNQLVDHEDDDADDDEYESVTYHFCSTSCLDLFVMAIPRDLEDSDTSTGD